MYLSKLEIIGFKSFAHKTVFEFSEGLTGIVGPNGCGKSNIVDAIRWVLGEQKVSVLRSDKMENVIFNGTRKRKPLGMAEVSLTIENNRNILPTEFTEVVITRRLYRSGESQYLLNGQVVRLKDIHNLFMDTGMSPDAYSIIELKMIELILSENKDERRRLFEEAAGIKKYKMHRRLALRKLEQTQIELNRVNDLLSEVQRNVNSLSRQVAKVKRYQRIKDELKNKEIHLQLFRYHGYLDSKKPLLEELEEVSNVKKKAASTISLQESELEQIKMKTLDIEQEFQTLQREISGLKDKIDELERNNLVAEQQIQHLEKEKERLKDEYQYTIRRLDEIQLALNNLQDQKEELQDEFYRHESQLELIEEEKQEKQQSLLEHKEKLARLESDMRTKMTELNTIKSDYNKIQAQLQSRMEEKEKLTQYIHTYHDEIQEKEQLVQKLEQEVQELRNEYQQLDAEYATLSEQLKRLNETLKTTTDNFNQADKHAAALENEVNIYENIARNYEGYSSAVKDVMKRFNQNGKLLETLPNTFRVNPSIRKWVATFIQEINNVIITNDHDLAYQILQNVRELKLGQIGVALGSGNGATLPVPESKCEPILQHLETETDYHPLLEKIFKYVFLVENLDVARQLHQDFPHCTFIAPEGLFIGPLSILKGGSEQDSVMDLVGRKSKIQELKLEMKKAIQVREQLIAEKEKLQKNIKDLTDTILRVEKERSQKLNNLQAIQRKFEITRYEAQSIQKRFSEEDNALKDLEKTIAELEKKQHELTPKLDLLEEQMDDMTDQLEELKRDIQYLESEFQRISEEYNSKHITKIKTENQLEQIEREMFQLNREREELEVKKDRLSQESDEDLQEEITRLKTEIDERKKIIHELYEQYSAKAKIRDEQETEYQNLKNLLLEKEDEIAQTRKRFYQSQERIKELEFKIQELDLKAQSIADQLMDFYEFDVKQEPETDMDLEHFNPETTQQEIQELRTKLERIGEVNPLAVEEYEKEKERLDFLKSQQSDILEAQDQLLLTIDELNKTATEKFLLTFHAIRENFMKVFKEFFPQGDATLEMVEPDDPLETDIHIRVTPKGRKLQTLTLMSAGEKTLTAISLLFAIYLVKPSPFCILDEVDAPLDDVNIGRFTQALRNFSNETQFIVVTHNKKTMEAMDAIYGVTMEEEGVSKVVSVQFKE
jgi:chromosome segregation protein